jgi:hypothetical protein
MGEDTLGEQGNEDIPKLEDQELIFKCDIMKVAADLLPYLRSNSLRILSDVLNDA